MNKLFSLSVLAAVSSAQFFPPKLYYNVNQVTNQYYFNATTQQRGEAEQYSMKACANLNKDLQSFPDTTLAASDYSTGMQVKYVQNEKQCLYWSV